MVDAFDSNNSNSTPAQVDFARAVAKHLMTEKGFK